MRSFLLLVILAIVMADDICAQYFPVDTARLNRAYAVLMAHSESPKAQRDFLAAFPDTWEDFIMTYQYVPDRNYDRSMFYRAKEHIDALYGLDEIPDSVYCRKLIHIAIGGRINPDVAHDWFGIRPVLHQTMKVRPDGMFAQLSRLRKGHRFEFWAYYWSTPFYRKEIDLEFRRLRDFALQNYPDEVEFMSDAFKYFHNGVNYTGMGFEREDARQE